MSWQEVLAPSPATGTIGSTAIVIYDLGVSEGGGGGPEALVGNQLWPRGGLGAVPSTSQLWPRGMALHP